MANMEFKKISVAEYPITGMYFLRLTFEIEGELDFHVELELCKHDTARAILTKLSRLIDHIHTKSKSIAGG